MKHIFKYLIIAAVVAVSISCKEDSLNPNSIFVESNQVSNKFDSWLMDNYIIPYNIEVKYRMEDGETNMSYTLVPATLQKSSEMAKLVKHLCLEAYDELVGREFIPKYFPKVIHFIGSPGVNANGTLILGTAEGGLKITLYRINSVDPLDVETLNESYFKTIHHEFAHILHQTISYPTDFKDISAEYYLGEDWSSTTNNDYLQKGFISKYSTREPNEDFVELYSHYILRSEEWWLAKYVDAGEFGAAKLKQKLDVVKTYMLASWGIDMDEMRKVISRRSSEVIYLDFNL